jgi:hypothetical protein
LLKLIYPKPVSTVLVHPLFGFPNDDTGKMALYKAKMPTPAAQYFWKVWGVIKLGYELLPNGIKGVTQSIVFDENGMYTIVKN